MASADCDRLCAELIAFGILLQHIATNTTLLKGKPRAGTAQSTSSRD